MPRVNPNTQDSHPATRWFEWNGEEGEIRFYDKVKKENISVGNDFTFILLDQLSVIKGWHDASESGITSNEVRSTNSEPFVVKAFGGGTLAQGLYSQIKDRVYSLGGHYTANLYVAFKNGDELVIGSLQLKGATLKAWMDFSKKNKAQLYSKAIRINGFTEGQKGKVKYRVPKFSLVDITPETDDKAGELQKELQAFLDKYFSRTKTAPVNEPEAEPFTGEGSPEEPPPEYFNPPEGEKSEQIPF